MILLGIESLMSDDPIVFSSTEDRKIGENICLLSRELAFYIWGRDVNNQLNWFKTLNQMLIFWLCLDVFLQLNIYDHLVCCPQAFLQIMELWLLIEMIETRKLVMVWQRKWCEVSKLMVGNAREIALLPSPWLGVSFSLGVQQ